ERAPHGESRFQLAGQDGSIVPARVEPSASAMSVSDRVIQGKVGERESNRFLSIGQKGFLVVRLIIQEKAVYGGVVKGEILVTHGPMVVAFGLEQEGNNGELRQFLHRVGI